MPPKSSNNTGNDIYEDEESYFYVYIIVGLLFLMAFGGGGWYYNNNYSDEFKLANSAAISANSANKSANTAAKVAAGANSAQADKAAADAAIAASAASAAAAETKKAAIAADLAKTKKAADDAKKADDDAKIALTKTLEACKNKLNIFTGTDGKKYICPPMYSFGNQNTYGYPDALKFAEKNENRCWLVHNTKKDCGWNANSCDPSTYTTPNGKKIALKEVIYGTPEMQTAGNYINVGPTWNMTNGSAYFINNPMQYSDAEYCPELIT